MATSNQGEGNLSVTHPASKLITWLKQLVIENSKSLIWGTLIVPVAGLLFLAAWGGLKHQMDKYVREIIVEDLKNEKSTVWMAINDTLGRSRQSEVGSLTAGTFALTPTTRSHTHYVYFPEGYKGKMFYQIKGTIVPDCRYVVLSLPNGKPLKLEIAEGSIILEKYFKRTSPQATEIDDVFERSNAQGLRKNLKAITFQLEGYSTDASANTQDSADCAALKAQKGGVLSATDILEISYATFVAPAVHIHD